ncbi:MAG: IS200/IS605 family transposase [Candidatus Eremiobacteraeota bacterium]|nr:IS200/IS605 family transposase [Candidatus Eremiobacteraeota bacterium]
MKEDFYWRTGRYSIFKNFIHLVFVTKYRRNVLTAKMLDRLHDIFLETCEQMEVELIQFGGEDDHVHLMVCCPPKLAIANLVGKLKGKSSYFIRQEFWEEIKNKLWSDHFWSPSYCVVSCGGAPLEIVKQYIHDQRRPIEQKQVKLSLTFTGKKRTKTKKWLT